MLRTLTNLSIRIWAKPVVNRNSFIIPEKMDFHPVFNREDSDIFQAFSDGTVNRNPPR